MHNWEENLQTALLIRYLWEESWKAADLGGRALVLWCKSEFRQFKGRFKAISLKVSFPGSSVAKETACNAGYLGLIPGLGWSPGGGHGYPLQYSCLENPHGQRNLEGCSPWSQRVGHWVTKHTHIKGIRNCADLAKPSSLLYSVSQRGCFRGS